MFVRLLKVAVSLVLVLIQVASMLSPGKIKDMVPEGGVDRMTRMVLVNALYFIGSWNETFDRRSTYEAQFRLNKNTTKPVQLMNQENYFPITVIREVDCQILEMPYRGKELSMLIILPKDIEDDTTGLEKLEKCLTYEKFTKWTHPNKMKRRKIEVKLPRFKLEETYDLNKVLGSMGMVDAFDQTKCDFSGMSGNKALYLSNVSHKAFVDVNEEGTEAGAVTDTKSYSLFDSPPNFIADHPFLFFIRHNRTLSVLFAGRFCCPE
ncbi:hypothetical protein CCH79_00016040 [Gambusia affinis]|uniref:Serpin B6 n=1 Tax=Gambusia affinis TaxID=33528 RepID=A0A315VPK8_GAMAF|nr:hypothetical protein CCH79_00016040 [Gambusia affinis]